MWQPIETAPYGDENPVLVWDEHYMSVASRSESDRT